MNLRKLGAALVLSLILAIAALAGETNSPPCAPGETSGPPLACQFTTTGSDEPAEIQTPPASERIDIVSLAEIGLRSLLFF